MGILKRIATARLWNPELWGGTLDPEIAAMRRLWKAEDTDRKCSAVDLDEINRRLVESAVEQDRPW